MSAASGTLGSGRAVGRADATQTPRALEVLSAGAHHRFFEFAGAVSGHLGDLGWNGSWMVALMTRLADAYAPKRGS